MLILPIAARRGSTLVMLRFIVLVTACACTSVPQVPSTSAASEDASTAPLPHVAVALGEDAPPLDEDASAPMDMSHHYHGGMP
jgi:hypothetical protein